MSSARRWPLVAVALLALAFVAVAFARFHAAPRQLWTVPDHDRNAHYWSAQSLALDLRHGDVGHFLRQLERFACLGATASALDRHADGRRRHRLRSRRVDVAVALGADGDPGLCVRASSRSGGGRSRRRLAALLVLASPAYQAFATDVMLESIGACLTLAVAYAYLRSTGRHAVGLPLARPGPDAAVSAQVSILAPRPLRTRRF